MKPSSLSRPNRLLHIDGMKGLLCFLIMLGHFWNIYRHCQPGSPLESSLLDAINYSFLRDNVLLATFWLYAFLVISGYLVSFSRITDPVALGEKVLKRFLRFFLPVLGACFCIWAIQKTVGYHAQATTAYFTSAWFQKYYRTDLDFSRIFTESVNALFYGGCRFNSPFWVIRDMFLSSIAIYLSTLTDHRLGKKTHVLPWLCLLAAFILDRQVIIACMAGFLIRYYENILQRLTRQIWPFLLLSLGIFASVQLLLHSGVLPQVFDEVLPYILLYCFALVTVNRFPLLQRIFSAKPFLLMGSISFGVYALHWPVCCSFGALALIFGIRQQWPGAVTFGAAFLFALFWTVLLAVLFRMSVERWTEKISGAFKIVPTGKD